MSTVVVQLAKPLVTHAGEMRSLEISEPRGIDYLRMGEPVTYGRGPDGTIFTVENEDVIQRYIESCVPKSVDPVVLEQLGLEDAIKIKVAILDFFRAARAPQSAKS